MKIKPTSSWGVFLSSLCLHSPVSQASDGRSELYINVFDCRQQGTGINENHQNCFYEGFTPLEPLRLTLYGVNETVLIDASDATAETVTGHFETVLDFLWEEWERDSWDGIGGFVTAGINLGPSSGDSVIGDAVWQGNIADLYFSPDFGFEPVSVLFFANNRAGTSWGTALDVVAHEFGHGVAWATVSNYEPYAGLGVFDPNFVDEPQAILEHLCDVMAALVDNFAGKNKTAVYSIFEDIFPPGSPLRVMNDPVLSRDAGTDWYSEVLVRPEDEAPDYLLNSNGYIYQTAGVPNLAFYLLAEGGAHPNATKASWTNVTVGGIGIENAGQIWYRAMTDCMFLGAIISDLRDCTETVAAEEFQDSVRDAWVAVGVTEAPTPADDEPTMDVPVDSTSEDSPEDDSAASAARMLVASVVGFMTLVDLA